MSGSSNAHAFISGPDGGPLTDLGTLGGTLSIGIGINAHGPEKMAVIFNFTSARRIHYGDFFDPKTGTIGYVGEGKTGDQSLNPRNKRLHNMSGTGALLDLFLDCGDLFSPKKLLYAGKWTVVGRHNLPLMSPR